MGVKAWLLGGAGAAFGVAAAGTAISVVRQQKRINLRAGEYVPFGALRSTPVTVVADDGVNLHVEIDELDPQPAKRRLLSRATEEPDITLVFVHGYCLNLDCWHFQRAAYRGLVRSVFYDQRSHGRSGNSDRKHSTIDQLGRDLERVLTEVVPDGKVVLIGHSMGGMSILALTEHRPDLIGDRVIGVGLISTTAGNFDPTRILLPMLPARLSGRRLAVGTVSALRGGSRVIDWFRDAGQAFATVATDRFAFGGDVPEGYLEFVDDMLSATPFEVVADFFPSFGNLDKFETLEVLSRVPVSIICGTADKMTSISHSRELHERIPGSTLLECEGSGHMVIMERHDQVDAALDQLITAATAASTIR